MDSESNVDSEHNSVGFAQNDFIACVILGKEKLSETKFFREIKTKWKKTFSLTPFSTKYDFLWDKITFSAIISTKNS